MASVVLISFLLFFAATVYATVILIQIGGWLAILAGLLLICSYFTIGPLGLLGLGSIVKSKVKKGEDIK